MYFEILSILDNPILFSPYFAKNDETGSPPPPVFGYNIITEDGKYLQTENFDQLITEDGPP